MHPEETTYKKLQDKIRDQGVKDAEAAEALEEQVQGKKKSKKKKGEEEEEVTNYFTRNMVITSFT